MKKLLSFVVMMLAVFALHSQTVIFEDNFDSYTAGTALTVQNNTNWVTWSGGQGTAEDPLVSTEQSQTNPNSIKLMGSNDIIYKFENQTTGHYTIEFDMFIPSSGNGGYFNIQHWANPGVMWAFEVYFHNNGNGYMLAGSTTQHPFNYPSNAWFHVFCDINLNADLAKLTINNIFVREWPFSYEGQSENGINQLGGVNIYAGAPGSASGTYFLDNFKVVELVSPTPGQFVIDPEEDIFVDVELPGTETKVINVSNPGAASINYEVVAVYDISEVIPTSTGIKEVSYVIGESNSGIWWNGADRITVATGLTPAMLKDHLGKTVRRFEFGLDRVQFITAAKLCIWEMGSMGMPSLDPPVYEQVIPVSSLFDGDNNSVVLQEPWLIDGRYLYIGIDLTVIPSTTAPNAVLVLVDECSGIHNKRLGRLIRSSVAWSELGGHLDGNWMLKAFVDGTPYKPWIALTNEAGTLQPDQDKDINFTFGATDIVEDGVKEAQLYFFSTDFLKEVTVLNVSANFIITQKLQLTVNITTDSEEYPSPAGAIVTLSNVYVNYEETSDDTGVTFSDLGAGTYSLKITLNGFAEHNETITITETGTHQVELKFLSVDNYGYNFKLYPNPATTSINIEAANIHTVEIYTLMGQKIYSSQPLGDDVEISTGNFTAGTYMVKVINVDGKTATQKLIVK